MTKLVVAVVILVSAAGMFLYTQQTLVSDNEQAVLEERAQQDEQNPFGEGSSVVGSLDDSDTMEDGEMEREEEDTMEGSDDTMTQGNTGTAPDQGMTTSTTGTTRTELAMHNMQSDCWVAYKGVVYDVTSWLPRHPGSAGAIAPYCGTADEFAAAFNKQHGTTQENRLKKEGINEGPLSN